MQLHNKSTVGELYSSDVSTWPHICRMVLEQLLGYGTFALMTSIMAISAFQVSRSVERELGGHIDRNIKHRWKGGPYHHT